ncbi:MAG: alpha/beta hydrolase [Cyanobacteria bacterium SID2]|nr:alpha/beta hydrolase [Cyanobacteria bacterium SID2]MBP0002597.1 alpha/beta hydrolase [Cyanobacteria bacterium SBC]
MFPEFLPPNVSALSERTSIEQAIRIQRLEVRTSLRQDPIATTYTRLGTSGTPIVLLHGFDSSILEFRRLQPLLARSSETWAVDLLGFGFTERAIDVSFTPSDIEAHLYGFWQAAIDRPIILVGASMGGAAAIDFSIAHPEAVERLVLLDSVGLTNGPVAGKYLVPPFDYLAAEFLRRPSVRNTISYTAYFDKQFNSEDARCCAALHLESEGWRRSLIAFTKSGGYPSLKSKLTELQLPTLVLWGEDDRILGTKDATEFLQLIPDSKLAWIPCCGHVPHLERPQTTAKQILAFRN